MVGLRVAVKLMVASPVGGRAVGSYFGLNRVKRPVFEAFRFTLPHLFSK